MPYDQDGNWIDQVDPTQIPTEGDGWVPPMPAAPTQGQNVPQGFTPDPNAGWEDWAGAGTQYGVPIPGGLTKPPAALDWNKAARNSVRDAWMSGSGSLEDFIKSNPYASHLHANNDILTIDQTPDDKYQWGPEQIDAVGDYGGANTHEWIGRGPGSDGPQAPAGGGGGGTGNTGMSSALTPFQAQLQASLMKILGGGVSGNPMTAAQFEAIRQPIEKGRRTQTNQAMAELANRGIIGEPGHASGPESTALSRIESNIAPDWATALENASVDNAKLGQGLFTSALGSANTEANRETTQANDISQIALGNLQENRLWNQFIAQFGLDQQKVAADIQSGNIANLIPLLDLFTKNAGTSANGYIA